MKGIGKRKVSLTVTEMEHTLEIQSENQHGGETEAQMFCVISG